MGGEVELGEDVQVFIGGGGGGGGGSRCSSGGSPYIVLEIASEIKNLCCEASLPWKNKMAPYMWYINILASEASHVFFSRP